MRWARGDCEEEGCRYVVAETPPQRTVSLGTAALLAGLCSALAAFFTALVLAPGRPSPPAKLLTMVAAAAEGPTDFAPGTEWLFAELTAEEARAVAKFAAAELGCATSYPGLGKAPSCYLAGSEAVSLRVPDKDDALAYLDAGKAAPARMAEAIVVHGDRPFEEGVGIYLVGPLDGAGGLAPGARVAPQRWLHFNRRPVDWSDNSADVVTNRVVRQLAAPLLESFGPVFAQLPESFNPEESGQLFTYYSPAVTSTLNRRVSRTIFNWFKDPENFEVCWMHPLPFYFDIIHEGSPEEWYAANITYCGQMFPAMEDILAQEKRGQLQRCTGQQDTVYGWDVAGPDAGTAAAEVMLEVPPPINKTWQISGRGSIRWGEWELLATVRPGSGLALYDVRWRGDRILYELALSDAHAYYSSPRSDKQFHYSDKAFSMAQISGDVVLGLDCPNGASLLDGASWMLSKGTQVISDPAQARPLKLACVYESNGFEGSLWRHAQLLTRQVRGRRHRSLVVRAVSTVGNYDYISEVHLGEDGSVHVRSEFAGYPEMELAAPFRQASARGRRIGSGAGKPTAPSTWGNRVRQDLVAYLHAHFCVWKVDLDVLGRANEFHTVRSSVVHTEGELPKKVQESARVEHEDPGTLLRANAATPGLWRIVNPDETSPMNGEPRGYAVMIQSAPALQTLPPDHPFSVAGSFAKRHLAVTRRKDTEPHATHSLDHYPLTSPLLSVDTFLSDRESLVKEDLVCWVSIGKEHITRTEDVPLVSNFGVQFALLPWSYSEENPAMQLPVSRAA